MSLFSIKEPPKIQIDINDRTRYIERKIKITDKNVEINVEIKAEIKKLIKGRIGFFEEKFPKPKKIGETEIYRVSPEIQRKINNLTKELINYLSAYTIALSEVIS